VHTLKATLLALFVCLSLIVGMSAGGAAWQEDGSSYYWDRNGAGN
jgi:hypothetical protein